MASHKTKKISRIMENKKLQHEFEVKKRTVKLQDIAYKQDYAKVSSVTHEKVIDTKKIPEKKLDKYDAKMNTDLYSAFSIDTGTTQDTGEDNFM